jgi:hypothetical protein
VLKSDAVVIGGGQAGLATVVDEPCLHLLGYGSWTGPASATLIGVGPTVKATVAKISAAFA